MRKIITALFSLFTIQRLVALPIGSPVEPALLTEGLWFSGQNVCCGYHSCCFDDWGVGLGYYGDFVFNRNLQIHGNGLGQGEVIRDTHINTNAAYLSLRVCRFGEIFATLGQTIIKIHTPEDSWTLTSIHEGTLFTKPDFSWSIGGRALLFNWRCFSLGIEGQYFQTCTQLSKYLSQGFVWVFTYFDDEPPARYTEWQIGGALSYTLKLERPNIAIVPYIGIKGSRAFFTTSDFTFVDVQFENTLTFFDLSAHKHVGFAVGTAFAFGGMMEITVEGRFADERAIYVNGQVCF